MNRSRARVTGVLAGAVAAHGLAVLVGWWGALPLLVDPPSSFIPMAPSTALAFLLLGTSLALRAGRPSSAEIRGAAALIAWAVAAAALLNLLVPARLDEFLGGGAGLFGSVPLGVMSPVTAGALLPLAAAVALAEPGSRPAGAGGGLAAVVGATVALGYAHGTPLLYGSATIPVALPTGLSLLVLGGAAVRAAGPTVWPLRPLAGDGTRARMLRVFLPAILGLVVGMGILESRLGELGGANRVLVSAWFAVAGVVLVALLVSRLSRWLGGELDRAYAERHQAEQRYRQMFEQTLAGVATTTMDGRILLCNGAYANIFGVTDPEDLIGRSVAALYWEPKDREFVTHSLGETGELRNFELRMRTLTGAPVWVLANLTLREETGGDRRIENTIIDVTQRKTLEQQLWQAQKLDALGSLAGGVAHDFNNLLTAIVGYTELIREDLQADDPHRDDLAEIERACGRASALTRQLLAFSRRQPFEPRALRLDESVREMEKMLHRLLGPAVRLVTGADTDLPPVWADPGQIEQVVLNLAVNARDAMPGGGTLTIETRGVELDEPLPADGADLAPGRYVQLAVRDTGTGMSQDTLTRIFEPFFTTKAKGKGTGLGLATVYGIVKQTRGSILVHSEVGVGTTFTCCFPATDAPITPAVAAVAPSRVGGPETILVVEDEPAILRVAVTSLERSGYRVLSAMDGDAAIRLAAEHDGVIHLVLSDGVLSGMRVPELLRRVRAGRPQTRILLMSGYSQEAVFHNEIVEPSTAFLAKPFTVRQLVTRVREVLDAPAPDSG